MVKATGARYGFNMLSAVSARGHLYFMTVEGRINAMVFCEFLRRLITGAQRKIFLKPGKTPLAGFLFGIPASRRQSP